MRAEVVGYVKKIVRASATIGPVLDIGGMLAVEQEVEFGGVIGRLFPEHEYRTLDLRPGADIRGDAHDTGLAPESYGVALLLETLEHLEYPQKAITEIYRILKPGGLAIVTTVQCWEEHRCPKDLWRFLPDGLLHLLTEAHFRSVEVEVDGAATAPSGIFVLGRK